MVELITVFRKYDSYCFEKWRWIVHFKRINTFCKRGTLWRDVCKFCTTWSCWFSLVCLLKGGIWHRYFHWLYRSLRGGRSMLGLWLFSLTTSQSWGRWIGSSDASYKVNLRTVLVLGKVEGSMIRDRRESDWLNYLLEGEV